MDCALCQQLAENHNITFKGHQVFSIETIEQQQSEKTITNCA